MFQKIILKSLKSFLLDSETKKAIFKAIDKAVADTASPIDDRAAAVFQSCYDTILAVI
jgi:hypothetical protein